MQTNLSRLRRLTAILMISALWASVARAETIRVSVDYPAKTEIGTWDGLGLVLGHALAYERDFDKIDVMFCIDVSGSTAASSGVDVDGDGRVGGGLFGGSGLQDSILALELAAVRNLLDRLDPRATRVGIVIFSGDGKKGTRDALLESELTRDYASVRRKIENIALVPPEGGTNMYAGLSLATRELIGGRGAVSRRRRRAQKLLVFLTDGKPTYPGNGATTSPEAVQKAIGVAKRAGKKDIRILSFGLGREGTKSGELLREVATLTGGAYVPVEDPGDLIPQFEKVEFLELAAIAVRNETLGEPARCAFEGRDGRFAALVPVGRGANEIAVRVSTQSGESVEKTFEVTPAPPTLEPLSERQEKDLTRLRALCARPEPKERKREIEVETEPGGAAPEAP